MERKLYIIWKRSLDIKYIVLEQSKRRRKQKKRKTPGGVKRKKRFQRCEENKFTILVYITAKINTKYYIFYIYSVMYMSCKKQKIRRKRLISQCAYFF